MSIGWRVVALSAAVVCAACLPVMLQAQRPQQLGKIVGQLRVSRGDFPSVPVLITLEFRGSPIQSAYCDDQGRFGFYSLVANEYRVSVNDDAYVPVAENVNVNPDVSPINIVQFTLVPREPNKKEDPASRVAGSNPYLIDPTEYYRRFPKKTLKEFDKGVEAENQGKTDDAMGHYEKALSYSPDFSPAHNHLGSAYLSRKKFEEAQNEFEAALKTNQNDAQAHFNLANVLLVTHHYDGAGNEIEEGLKRQPNSAFGHFLQGSMYSHTNRPELAEKSLRTALQYDPKMSQASLQLVNLYLQQKRPIDAISELESYLKAFPDTPFAPQARDLLKRLQGDTSSSPQ
jgi:predicted negative regulator of RcsB-dependent stress response